MKFSALVFVVILAIVISYVECTQETLKVVRALNHIKQQMRERSLTSLQALETVGLSAEDKNTADVSMLLQSPEVQSAMNAETPDAVDRLIQGILEGKGSGGVVTTEFNQGGVHATIISNVNELRVTQVDHSAEERKRAMSEHHRKKLLAKTAAMTQEQDQKKQATVHSLESSQSESSHMESSESSRMESSGSASQSLSS
jgi:hypothetical protein